jgi:hypothetical protein
MGAEKTTDLLFPGWRAQYGGGVKQRASDIGGLNTVLTALDSLLSRHVSRCGAFGDGALSPALAAEMHETYGAAMAP